ISALQPFNKEKQYIQYVYQYDLNHHLTKQSVLDRTPSKLVVNSENQPAIIDDQVQNISDQYQYDEMGNKKAHSNANGSVEYFYHNAIKKLIARTKVSRTQFNLDGDKTIIPVIYYGYNVFGEKVREIHFKTPATSVNPDEIPVVNSDPANDQQKLW